MLIQDIIAKLFCFFARPELKRRVSRGNTFPRSARKDYDFSSLQQDPTYQFGVFELNVITGELRKHGIRLQLQQQPLRVLRVLLERAGEVVTREEIQKTLWPDETFVDFDNAINGSVRKLRDALGENAGSPRYIETLSRRGYRFIAPVSHRPESAAKSVGSVQPPAIPVKTQWRWRTAMLAAVPLIVLCLAAGFWFVNSKFRQENTDSLLTSVPLTSYPGYEVFPSFSPEGTRVAFSWQQVGSNRPDVYVKLLGTGEPIRLSSAGGIAPAWSRDGRFIAYLRPIDNFDAAVVVVPALGGQEREVTRTTNLVGVAVVDRDLWGLPAPLLAWSPDGKWLLTLDQRIAGYSPTCAIVRVSVQSGEKHVVTSPFPRTLGDAGLAISPDGRRLAFTRDSSLWIRDIYTMQISPDLLPEGKPERVTFDNKRIGGLAWTSDGKNLVFSSSRGGRAALWRLAPTPGAHPVRLGLAGDEPSDIALSSDGTHLVYSHRTEDQDVWRASLSGDHVAAPRDFISSTRRDTQPQYSPDGKRIAFESARSGNEEIWVCNADSSSPVQLTSFGNAWAGAPMWSPDGEKITFAADAAGNWDIYVIDSRGGRLTRLTNDGVDESWPTWSRDGKWIYYFSTRSKHAEIWKMRATGGPEVQVTKHGGLWAMESVDGKDLYYSTEHEIWRMPLRGGDEVKIADTSDHAVVAPVKRGIYFVDDSQLPLAALRIFDFKTQRIRVVGELPGPFGWGMSVSPDERWLLFGKEERQGSELMLIENFR